jgi:hypothetical protein
MINSLVTGDIKIFGKLLKQFVLKSISYFDVGGYEGEKVYHAFVLGMLISLNDTHEVLSNRESGYGRYDVMIIPKDISRLGIIIEFKKLDPDDEETLEETAEEALKQIAEKKYSNTLEHRGIKNIKELAIVFKRKKYILKKNKTKGRFVWHACTKQNVPLAEINKRLVEVENLPKNLSNNNPEARIC